MIELELLSGGNIRFEEIKVDSDQGHGCFYNFVPYANRIQSFNRPSQYRLRSTITSFNGRFKD